MSSIVLTDAERSRISSALGGNMSFEDYDAIVNMYWYDDSTKAKYEEQRTVLDNSNKAEVNQYTSNPNSTKDEDGLSVINTGAGNVIPNMQDGDKKPSESEIKAGYCYSVPKSSNVIQFPVKKDDVVFNAVDKGVQDLVQQTEAEAKEQDSEKKKFFSSMNNVNKAYRDEGVVSAKDEALNNPNKCNKQADSKVLYHQDSFTSKGEAVNFTSAAIQTDWMGYFSGDVEKDLDSLRGLVSRFISKNYGGFKNIRRIVVRDHRLIINNKSCYIPKLSKECLLSLPLDAQSYLRAGALAQFFDWGYISKMPNLGVIDIDSADFILDWVLPDLGWGGATGVDIYKAFFYNVTNLRELIIKDEVISRSDLANLVKEQKETGTTKSSPILETMSRKAKWKKTYRDTIDKGNTNFWNKAFDGKAPNIIGTADAWREWQWGTVKNFATNRGDKGFLRYSFGTIGRAGFALAITPLTFAPRLIKGLSTMLVGVFREATTAISDEDIYDKL